MQETLEQLKTHFNRIFSTCETLIYLGPMELAPFPTLEEGTFGLVFLDGGVRHKEKTNGMYRKAPSVSLGDGDSLIDKQNKKEALEFLFPTRKDFSDLALANHCVEKNIQNIHALGLIGGKLDHQLANLGEFHDLLTQFNSTLIIFLHAKDYLILASNSPSFPIEIEGGFSVLSLEKIEIQITGNCEYTCNEPITLNPLSSRGLSNIGHGKITFTASGPFFLIIDGNYKIY